ncbi:MAG: hypothetical protein HQ483_07160 [Rhodospirillales bacterium]|nr:hypothetical protein [Rhodospirillales bacterium]
MAHILPRLLLSLVVDRAVINRPSAAKTQPLQGNENRYCYLIHFMFYLCSALNHICSREILMQNTLFFKELASLCLVVFAGYMCVLVVA